MPFGAQSVVSGLSEWWLEIFSVFPPSLASEAVEGDPPAFAAVPWLPASSEALGGVGCVGGAPVGRDEMLPDGNFRIVVPRRGARHLKGLTLLARNEDIITYKDITQ